MRLLRYQYPHPAALSLLAVLVLASTTVPVVDAARSWSDVVHPSKRGYGDSSKGGPEVLLEANPFEPFVEADADIQADDEQPSPQPSFRPSAKPSKTKTVEPTASPTDEPTLQPSTAKPTLEPSTQAPTYEPTARPTASPTFEPSPGIWGVIDDDADCSSSNPCGPCQGRCSDDDDCLPGLLCYERDEDAAVPVVPGCEGDPGNARKNYCVVPEGAWGEGWRLPTTSPTERPSASPSFRPTDEPTSAPTFAPTDEPTRAPVTPRPTYSPLPDARFVHDAECGSDHHEKCDRCMGPCRRDSHCHPGLKCMERSNNRKNRDVPGCVGEPETGTNYCYLDPEDAEEEGGWAAPTPTATPSAAPSASPTISHQPTLSQRPSASPTASPTQHPAKVSDSFQLRMWWERGYNWQGSSRPSDWCVRGKNKILEIEDCSSKKSEQKFVNYAYTIRPKTNQDKCFTKDGNDVILEDCKGDLGSVAQQWVLDTGVTKKKFGGDVDRDDLDAKNKDPIRRPIDVLREEEKFEIHPKADLNKCISNHHQPRNGETLMIQDCVIPRMSDTSFWKLE